MQSRSKSIVSSTGMLVNRLSTSSKAITPIGGVAVTDWRKFAEDFKQYWSGTKGFRILFYLVPDQYCLKSSTEFLQSVAATPPAGMMASLDVESLFTNVPVDETIDLLLDHICRNPDTPHLDIPVNSLRRLLQMCTKEAPFCGQQGNLWKQIDGIAR